MIDSLVLAALVLSQGSSPQAPSPQDLDRPVTFSARADRAQRVVAELSKQVSVPLQVSPKLAREMLVVDVGDVPLRELLSRIARATSAEWEPSGERLVLTRRDDVDARLLREEREFILKGLRENALIQAEKIGEKAYDAHVLETDMRTLMELARRNSPEDLRARVARSAALGAMSPCLRAATRLLPLLDFDALLQMEPETGYVMALNPTRVQRPIPDSMRPVVNDYVRELAIARTAASRLPALQVQPAAQVANVLVFVKQSERSRGRATVQVQVYALDQRGWTVSPIGMAETSSRPETKHGVDYDVVVPENLPDDGTFSFSSESIAFHHAIKEAYTYEGRRRIDMEFYKKLLHPEEFHSHSLLPTDALFAIARKAQKNLVANLAEDADLLGAINENGIEAFYSRARHALTAHEDLEEDDRWLILAPRFAPSATAERPDPLALGVGARMIASGSAPTLVEAAGLERTLPSRLHSYEVLLPVLAFGGIDDGGFDLTYDRLLPFFASLTPPQRAVLDVNRGLLVGDLTQVQRDLLTEHLFRRGEPVLLEAQTPEAQAGDRMPESEEEDFATHLDHVALTVSMIRGGLVGGPTAFPEASLLLPNGLPPDAVFTMTTEEEPILFGVDGGKRQMVDIENIAMHELV
jgi:hypothetical protein